MTQKLTLFMLSLVNTHTHTHTHTHTPWSDFPVSSSICGRILKSYILHVLLGQRDKWDKWLTDPKKTGKEKREKDGY